MAGQDVEITARINDEGVIAFFDQAGQKVSEFKQTTDDGTTSINNFANGAQTFVASAAGIATVLSAAGAAAGATAVKLASMGDAFLDARDGLQALAEQAGTTAEAIFSQANAALLETVDSTELLQSASKALSAGLNPEMFDEVAFAAKQYADATGMEATAAIDKFVVAITKGNEKTLNQLGLLKDGRIVLQGYTAEQLAAAEAAKGMSDIIGTILTKLDNWATRIGAVIDQNKLLRSALQLVSKEIDNLGRGLLVVIKLADQISEAFAKAGGINLGLPGSESISKIVAGVQQGTISVSRAIQDVQKELLVLGQAAGKTGDAFEIDLNKPASDAITGIDALIKKLESDINTANFEPTFNKIVDAFNAGELSLEQLQGATKEFYSVLISGGVSAEDALARLSGALGNVKEGMTTLSVNGASEGFLGELLKAYESAIANALGSVLSGDFKGGLANLGGAIGSQWGPIGAVIGEKLGEEAFNAFDHMFSGRDAAGKMRDSLDRFFAELLADNPLQAIIDGQLQSLTDLDFMRGTSAFESGSFDDLFQSLTANAQMAFQGVADAFAGIAGVGEDLSSQLAAIFANNLGGSLNNLQLLVQATGKSFEDLRGSVVEAFLDSKLSALEAQSALVGIAQVAQKGIPDGLGLVAQAFDNLKAAGTKGGRALVDALQDIAFEAAELNIQDFPALISHLISTGANADEVRKVFDALGKTGIDSINELQSATTEQLLPALAELEATKFPFAEAAETVDQLIEKVNKLPEEIRTRVVFDVQANYSDKGAEKAFESFGVGQARGVA